VRDGFMGGSSGSLVPAAKISSTTRLATSGVRLFLKWKRGNIRGNLRTLTIYNYCDRTADERMASRVRCKVQRVFYDASQQRLLWVGAILGHIVLLPIVILPIGGRLSSPLSSCLLFDSLLRSILRHLLFPPPCLCHSLTGPTCLHRYVVMN